MASGLEHVIADAEATGEPWVIQRDGEPVAVLCPADLWRQLTEAFADNEETPDVH